MKIELLPLNKVQRVKLLRESCIKLSLNSDSNDSYFERIHGLDKLAFGHTANAVEVAENIQCIVLMDFVELLQKEIKYTEGISVRVIGFF